MKNRFIYIFNLIAASLCLSIFMSETVKAAILSKEEYEQLSEIFKTGQTEELKKKIASGLNINASYQCHRPLNMAIRTMAFAYGSTIMPQTTPSKVLDMIEILIAAGVNVNTATSPGCEIEKSPIEEAIALPTTLRGLNYIFTETIKEKFNEIIAECSKTNSQDIKCQEASKENMDMFLTEINKAYALKQKELEPDALRILKYLIAAGADINQKDSNGRAALHQAVVYQNKNDTLNIIKFLVENGADINAQDINGRTPLFSTYDNPEVRQYLIQAGANTNHRDNNGNLYNEMTGQAVRRYKDDEGYHEEIAKY